MLETIQPIEKKTAVPTRTIQVGKSKRPFFFLHGAWTGGTPLYCFTLARTLGRDQPFYGLDPYNVDGLEVPATLEEMATAHIQAMRAIQPEGPYQLGGFCSGAFLSYEMARQLKEQGQEVNFLLLVAPSNITDSLKKKRNIFNSLGVLFHINQKQQLSLFLRLRHALRHLYRKILPPEDGRIEGFSNLLALEPRLNIMFPPMDALYKDFPGLFTWLAADYKPHFLPKNVTFIWAGDDLGAKTIWESIEQDKDSTIIPGPYMGLIGEHLHLLAEQLKMSLSKA